MIGTTRGNFRQGLPITVKQSQPGVVTMDWLDAAGVVPMLQGDSMAVAPVADVATGRLPPEIPGGLQLEKVLVVVSANPQQVDLNEWLLQVRTLHIFLYETMTSKGYF